VARRRQLQRHALAPDRRLYGQPRGVPVRLVPPGEAPRHVDLDVGDAVLDDDLSVGDAELSGGGGRRMNGGQQEHECKKDRTG